MLVKHDLNVLQALYLNQNSINNKPQLFTTAFGSLYIYTKCRWFRPVV